MLCSRGLMRSKSLGEDRERAVDRRLAALYIAVRRTLADVAETCGLDLAGVDQSLLRAVVDRLAELPVEVGRPDEEPLLEVLVELGAQRREGVQAGVVCRPLVETLFRRAWCAVMRRRTVLEVPARRWLVEPVPRVLVDDQPAPWPQQLPDLRKRTAEIGNVMKGQVCQDGVERAWVGELLQRDRVEDGAHGCPRIDRVDLVTQPGDRQGEGSAAAADLQHTARSRWQMCFDKRSKGHWLCIIPS